MVDQAKKDQIWARLRKIALEDGELSPEEQELMKSIIDDIEEYSDQVDIANEDGKIDKKEERDLFEWRIKIIEKAYAKARTDKIVTKEERALLKEIIRIIRTM